MVWDETWGWSSVCDDSFSRNDANVVCQDLFGTDAAMADQVGNTFDSFHGDDGAFTDRENRWIIFDNLGCDGSESSLYDCPHNGNWVHNCVHSEDAWVICSNSEFKAPASLSNQVQLSHEGYGYVMVWGNGRWNTVCDDRFGLEEAQVICASIYGTTPSSRVCQRGGGLGWRFSTPGFEWQSLRAHRSLLLPN